MQTQSKKCLENHQQHVETSNLHIKPSSSKNTQQGKKAIPQVGPKISAKHEEVKTERKSNAARSRRRCIVDENDSPTKNLLSKFQPIAQNTIQQENTTPNTSEIANLLKPKIMPDGARGRRLRKLMIEQNCPRYGGMTAMRKKEIIYEPEEIQELNEVIEKRCCICLEEMKAKTRPEECSHVFCRTCITAWTDTFSNLCPLCKIEIKYLLIYKERPDFEEGCENEESIENESQYNTVVDKIKVTKPVINDQISDWVQSFADNCYVCNLNDNDPQLLVCDKCNFNICHTYCCGLQSIPEGEWFCQDCLAEMEEQEKRKKQVAERRRKTRLQNQAKKRKMMEEEIGGSEDESSTESQEHQDDITAKLKQSDIYNESDEDDHIIKPLWRKQNSQSTTEVNDTESRKQVLESKFAKKKKFTSSLIAKKKENQQPKRINTSSLEMLRGQNQKREEQWLQAENKKETKTHKDSFQPSRIADKKHQPIVRPPPSTCLMMINPQNALNTYIPPFKTSKFGNSLKLTAAPPRGVYNQLLQPKSDIPQDPAAKTTFRKSKSLSEESNDGKKSTGHSDDLAIVTIEDQKPQEQQQPPKQKKKGISFKEPTPQKQPEILKKIGHDFDIFEIISPQKPSIQIIPGTSSAGKATYANLIDSSNIINGSIRYRIQQQQQQNQKKQLQNKSISEPSQPKKKKQTKKRAKKDDDEVEEMQSKNKKGAKNKKEKKVPEKEQAKKKPKKVVDLSDDYNCTDEDEDEFKDDTYDSDENLEDEIVPSSKKRIQKSSQKERQRGNKRRIEEESD